MAVFDRELDELRLNIDCRALLEKEKWSLDAAQSTTRAAKYRDDKDRIVIVTHDGKAFFAPLEDNLAGDVFKLAQWLWGCNFGEMRRRLRPLAGVAPRLEQMRVSKPAKPQDLAAKWEGQPLPRSGSQGWRYMVAERALPLDTVKRAVAAGVLREGIYGTLWAAHRDASGVLTGYEMRGPQYKGFCNGGHKRLFWVGAIEDARRVCVSESWIDALSLAAIENWHSGTAYASTGGGYGPGTVEALAALVPKSARLVAATDEGEGGEILSRRLSKLAVEHGLAFSRRRPEAKDWNQQLQDLARVQTNG